MANDLNQYSATSVNWRKTLRQNNQRTYVVITLFFLIYAGIGLLVDMYMSANTYPYATMSQLFTALITLHIFPIATAVMFAVAALSLYVSYAMYDTLMLMGTEYHEVTPETAQTLEEKQLYNII